MNRRLLGFFLWSVATSACALEPMDEPDLAGVTGQQGIAIGIEYGVNTDATGAPLAALGTGCTVGTDCRLAWSLAGRTDVWTVFKNSYMSLSVPALNIGVQPSMATIGSNTAYFDATRFQAADGSCLLAGGVCTTAQIDSLPAILLFYPATASTSYNSATGVSTGYTSVGLGLTIGRLALEFGATAYLNDANGSFLGLKIADNNGNFAQMAIAGKAYVYGF